MVANKEQSSYKTGIACEKEICVTTSVIKAQYIHYILSCHGNKSKTVCIMLPPAGSLEMFSLTLACIPKQALQSYSLHFKLP